MRGNNILGILFANINDDMVHELTKERAMASIPFGGRYRMIDFPLSCMANSGISKVGVVTKSNYQSLLDHVGSGKAWDLSRKRDGLYVLPPFGNNNFGYNNRIESLAAILLFIQRSAEEYVLLGNCDNICNIDFSDLAAFHMEKDADITVVYRRCTAPRREKHLAVYTLNEESRVTDLLMDPSVEGEVCCGTGFFLIRRTLLVSLINACVSRNNYNFVRDVIQKNLPVCRVFGYEFTGAEYTICSLESYFGANMALLRQEVRDQLFCKQRPIYTKVHDDMPARYGLSSSVSNSLVADGCVIDGEIENCVLFRGVRIAKGAQVRNCILMQGTEVGRNCMLDYTVTDKDVRIGDGRALMGFSSYPMFISKGSTV